MKKTYVLDTSVIIHDPYCIEKFPNSNIIIQIHVLNELDNIKRAPLNKGKNARTFIRMLDEICLKGKIQKGVKIENISSILKVDSTMDDLLRFGDPNGDNKILACAFRLKETQSSKVILVSRDINLRVRAQAFGVNAENYEKEDIEKNDRRIDTLYSGITRIKNAELSTLLCKNRILSCDGYKDFKNILPNECVYICDEYGSGITLGRRIKNEIHVVRDRSLWGLLPRNKEQTFAADLLVDTDIHLLSLIGKAGTGKSLISIAAGLELLITQKQYDKIFIFRPIQPVGAELGYLPGDLEEKLGPWMEAIIDSFEVLTSKHDLSTGGKSKRKRKTTEPPKENWKKNWRDKLAQYSDSIYLEPITYLRGRSIPNAYIILDECQNTTPDQIKTVLTRAGEGTKIVLTGDIEQTDHAHLDAMSNGLTYVASAFRHSNIAGHITLVKGERSLLATEAARIL